MKLTPIDIQQQQFRRTFRGFDPGEVVSFMQLAAEQLQDLVRDNTDMRAELQRREAEVQAHRDRETTLREAMLTAQRAIDEIREQAQKEAQLIVSEAELRSEELLEHAQRKVNRIVDEIDDLQRQRRRAMAELRGVLNTHLSLLEVEAEKVVDGNRADEPGNVTVLQNVRPPRPPESRSSREVGPTFGG